MTQKKILMMSGMIAVGFYVLHVVTGGLLWHGYSHLQQPISDLTASGAPNRSLLQIFTILYGVLALLFALSFTIFESRNHSRIVFTGGIFFIILHCISLSYGLFPEDLHDTGVTFTGIMHIVITILIVPFTILTPVLIGSGLLKEKAWKRFGILSIVTSILIFIFGGTTAAFYANKLPYFGLVERLNIGILQLWMFCFSWKLFKSKNSIPESRIAKRVPRGQFSESR